jgi:hypothetical protein
MLQTKSVKIVYRDNRGRFSLAKFTDHDMFMVDVADDGVLTLTPMIAMPQAVSEKIDQFLADPSKGVKVTRPGQRYEEIGSRAA